MRQGFSTLPHTKLPPRMYRHQRGMILIVGLIMVLLMTIIGLAAIRGSGLQESMAANMRDINVAFQAAESALRVCEQDINPAVSGNVPQCLITNDLNTTPATSIINNETAWLNLAKTKPLTAISIPNVASQPNGLLEKLTPNGVSQGATSGSAIGKEGINRGIIYEVYRVTAKGVGATDTTQVQLQTTYIR